MCLHDPRPVTDTENELLTELLEEPDEEMIPSPPGPSDDQQQKPIPANR